MCLGTSWFVAKEDTLPFYSGRFYSEGRYSVYVDGRYSFWQEEISCYFCPIFVHLGLITRLRSLLSNFVMVVSRVEALVLHEMIGCK